MELNVDVPPPHVVDEILEVIKDNPHEIFEVIKDKPQERMMERILDQMCQCRGFGKSSVLFHSCPVLGRTSHEKKERHEQTLQITAQGWKTEEEKLSVTRKECERPREEFEDGGRNQS